MSSIIRNYSDLQSIRPGQIGFYVDPAGDSLTHKVITAGQRLEGSGARAAIIHTFVVTHEDGQAVHGIGVSGAGAKREAYPLDKLGDHYLIVIDPPTAHAEKEDTRQKVNRIANRMAFTQRQVQYSHFGCIKAILGRACLGPQGKQHVAQAFADTILGLPFLDPKGHELKSLTCSYFVSLCVQVAYLQELVAHEDVQRFREFSGSLERRRQCIIETVMPIIEANQSMFGFDASSMSPAALAKFLGVEVAA